MYEQTMIPTPGRIVMYKLAQFDADAINKRREDYRTSPAEAATGFQAHTGNHVQAGDEFPAIIAKVWSVNPSPGSAVNLQVFLDGNDTYWATSRVEGENNCQWHPPVRA